MHITCRWLLRMSRSCSLWLYFNMLPSWMPSDGISLLSAKYSSRRMSFIFTAVTETHACQQGNICTLYSLSKQGQFQCTISTKHAQQATVVGVMKIGNIVPRAGLEPTSLAFWASVLPLHHVGSLTSPLYPRPHVYAVHYPRGQCGLLQ